MSVRTEKTTPFQGGQSTNDKQSGQKVSVKSNMSKTRDSGRNYPASDSLHASLGHKTPMLPSDNHVWTHTTTITPVGAHYEPRGEFGSTPRQGAGKGVYDYGGNKNKKGDNALGKAMNKVGEKSGYKKFTPKGGGKNV